MTVAFDENAQERDRSVIFKFNGEFEDNSTLIASNRYFPRIGSTVPNRQKLCTRLVVGKKNIA